MCNYPVLSMCPNLPHMIWLHHWQWVCVMDYLVKNGENEFSDKKWRLYFSVSSHRPCLSKYIAIYDYMSTYISSIYIYRYLLHDSDVWNETFIFLPKTRFLQFLDKSHDPKGADFLCKLFAIEIIESIEKDKSIKFKDIHICIEQYTTNLAGQNMKLLLMWGYST